MEEAPGGGAPMSTSVNSKQVRLRCRGSAVSFTRYVLGSSDAFTRYTCFMHTSQYHLDCLAASLP